MIYKASTCKKTMAIGQLWEVAFNKAAFKRKQTYLFCLLILSEQGGFIYHTKCQIPEFIRMNIYS